MFFKYSFFFSQELKTFKCRQCSLQHIKPEVFSLIPKLSELNLGLNQFKHFEHELEELKSLRILILDHNHIHDITNHLFNYHHKSLEHLGKLKVGNKVEMKARFEIFIFSILTRPSSRSFE